MGNQGGSGNAACASNAAHATDWLTSDQLQRRPHMKELFARSQAEGADGH